MLRFTADARSEAGLVRAGNEDSGFVSSRLLLVADGVGGNAAGEVASATAAWTLSERAHERVGLRPTSVLADATAEAQRRIAAGAAADPALAGLATTVTALLTDGHRCALAHLGDSRAYRLRDGELCQLSTDHTWVQLQVSTGQLSAEDAATHPWRHVVVRSLNATPESEVGADGEPDVFPVDLRSGDRLLLCSDGLSDLVDADTVVSVLAGHDDGQAADRLVESALRAGGTDNITVVTATVHDVAQDDTDQRGGLVGAVLDHRNVLGEPAGRVVPA